MTYETDVRNARIWARVSPWLIVYGGFALALYLGQLWTVRFLHDIDMPAAPPRVTVYLTLLALPVALGGVWCALRLLLPAALFLLRILWGIVLLLTTRSANKG